jgi:hypothetical protein
MLNYFMPEQLPTPPQNIPLVTPEPQNRGVDPTEFQSFKNILWAVVIIMILMVAQMLMESWNNKNASYGALMGQVNQQNIEIQRLIDLVNKKP